MDIYAYILGLIGSCVSLCSVVELLPLGIQREDLDIWIEVVDLLHNAILLLFLAMMSWIFR